MSRRLPLAFLLVAAGALLVTPASGSTSAPLLNALALAPDTGPLPDTPLTTLGGERVSLRRARGLTVVNFWATWCAPCREELRDLEELHRSLADSPVRILAVNVGETRPVITRYRREQNLTLPMVVDPDRRFHKLYEHREFFPMPRTVLVENGTVVANAAGVLPFGKPAVHAALRRYAREYRKAGS